jgi:nucleoside-diphosphate-sugar epimerase
MGFIHSAECEIMRNSALINIHMIDSAASRGIKRYFFSSSVCVYRNMKHGEPEMPESGAYLRLTEYGWEKLTPSAWPWRGAGTNGVRIALQNCGPEGTWRGQEKRKPLFPEVAEAETVDD